MGQPLLDLSDSLDNLSITSLDAGLAALSLSGTRARYGAAFKRVEDDAVKGDGQFLTALHAFDEFQSMRADDPRVQKATDELNAQARVALEATDAYKGFALAYERAINHQNRALARSAFAAAMGQLPLYVTSWSSTHGTLYGNEFSASTTGEATISDPGASWRLASQRYELDAQADTVSLFELRAYLTEYKSTIELLSHTWYPITQTWVAACRAAHELGPAPSLDNEIKMAKEALAKGVSPDAVLRMFMQRTGLSERDARTYLGLPQKQ